MTVFRNRNIACQFQVTAGVVFLAAILLPLHAFSAEEFKWNFGDAEPAATQTDKPAAAVPAPAAEMPAQSAIEPPAAPEKEPVKEDKPADVAPVPKPEQPAAAPDVQPVADVGPATAPDVKSASADVPVAPQLQEKKPEVRKLDNLAYEEMLSENLDLRKKISEASGEATASRKENERLAREVRDLEQRIGQFATRINDLKNEKGSAVEDPEKVKKLEQQVVAAEKDKAALADELGAARQKLATLASAPPAPEIRPTETVLPGSDLFKEKEEENQRLKKNLARIEAEKQSAVEANVDMEKRRKAAEAEAKLAAEKQKETEERLKEAMNGEKLRQKDVQKIAEQIPRLEKELSEMKTTSLSKEAEVAAKEKDLEAMKAELRLREQRLIKAEKMARLMEKAREEISRASETEKRDMHYNMGVVYAKEGRYRDAEAEYLNALSIDPTDSNCHYNLGVLYDDVFHDQKRAAMHYRRYIKLNPHGSDIDAVKSWLMRIEMKE